MIDGWETAQEQARTPRCRLHGAPDNANLVVRMVLEELGAEYDFVHVDRVASEQKSETYRQLNPQGLIPVLEWPGQDAPVFETGAIVLMLVDHHRRLAPVQEAPERGRFLKWLFFLSNTLHADLRISFKPHRYFPAQDQSGVFAAALRKRIDSGFQLLERELVATGGPFLLGPDPGCLDFYAAACARWAQIYGNCGRWELDSSPGLRRIFERLECRPAVKRACEMELIAGAPFTKPVPVTLAREQKHYVDRCNQP
ncbi:MAG: glutathione S-transferase family protein [Roseibium album]|uniref:glutathione S-transferase family protein n=1 Tax=Roseibium album TaxID=311410 RepID=UPI0032EC853F